MKKYTLFLFLLLFSFGLFVFGLNSVKVQASGAPIGQAFSCTGSTSFGAGSFICSGSDTGLTQNTSWGLYPSCSNIYLGTVKCSYSCDTSKGYMYSGGKCVVDPNWRDPSLPPAPLAALVVPTLSGPSTAKVGDVIKFTVTLANQISGCPTVLTGAEPASCNRNALFVANPFYLRPTGNFGEFKVINPGTLTVSVQLGALGQIKDSKIITLTGVGPVSTKGVKISTSKDLTGVMFDLLSSNCDKRSLDGCVFQNSGSNARNGLGIVDDPSTPAIYTAVENMGITTTSGTTATAGPVYYSIADPLNPVINSAVSYPTAYVSKGTGFYIHAYVQVDKVIYSKDGAYSSVTHGEGPKWMFEGSKRFDPRSLDGVLDRNIDAFIVQFAGYTISINSLGSANASNLTNLTGTCTDEDRSGSIDICSSSNGTKKAVSTPLPPLFPTMGAGVRIPLANQQFIASFEGGGQCGQYIYKDCATSGKKLVIYDLMSKTPAATLSLPGTFGPISPGGLSVSEKKIGNVDYIYALSNMYTSVTSGNNLLSIYKYDNLAKKLTTVTESLAMPAGEFATSISAVNINNLPGLAVFSAVISSSGAASPDSHGHLRVYMISDLASGKLVDALGGTGTDIVAPSTNVNSGSYTKGNSSYLYYYDVWNNNRTYVFQLDSTSGSSLTPPVSSDDCAPGDLYSRFTGQRCVADNNSLVTYNVNTSAGIGGTISPFSKTVISGLTTSFTVSPNSGYLISSVTGCSGSLSRNTYITGPITGACTVSASFSPSSTDCTFGDLFSRSTGVRCSSLDCAQGDLFSTITGKACSSN